MKSLLQNSIGILRALPGYVALTSISITLLAIVGILGKAFLAVRKGSSADIFVTAAVVVVTTIVVFFLSLAISRFFMRLVPIRADGRARWFVVSVAGIVTAYAFLKAAVNWRGELLEALIYTVFFLVPALFLWRHLLDSRRLRNPFVLFMRRFGGFADRSLVAALLRALPAGTPAATLVRHGETIGSWDPLVLAFGGLKLRRPLASTPIYLRTPDSGWQPRIEELIRESKAIVIDVSQASDSMQVELRLIEMTASVGKVALVQEAIDSRPSNGTSAAPLGPTLAEAKQIIYRKSWRGAIMRTAIAGPFIVLPVLVILLQGVEPNTPIVDRAPNPEKFAEMTGQLAGYLLFWLVFLGTLVWRKMPTRQSREQLKQLLGDLLR